MALCLRSELEWASVHPFSGALHGIRVSFEWWKEEESWRSVCGLALRLLSLSELLLLGSPHGLRMELRSLKAHKGGTK